MQSALLRWYGRSAREMPWRNSSDPYAIWVSEIMLQQTRVDTVIPYYLRFLRRFPTVAALAAASEDEVLAAWSGLGYYRRARSLLAGARKMVRDHGGAVPAELSELGRIPGIGRYTAGAVASIAFHLREPVVDGNIRRVFSRLTGGRIRGDRTGDDETACWELAGALVDRDRPGDLNQSLMELGATVCTRSEPQCRSCPVSRWCEGFAAGDPERFPRPAGKPATVKVRAAVAAIRKVDRVLLEKPGERSPLRGTWDLPTVEYGPDQDGGAHLATALREGHGLEIGSLAAAAEVSHGIMNRRISLTVYRCSLRSGRVAGREDLRWVKADRLDEMPVSGATLKVMRAMRS